MDHSPPGSSVPGDSPGKNTGVGCHTVLRNKTCISCISGRFITVWASGESLHASKWKWKSEVARLCPTLWDPVNCSLPVSHTHGILQARILGWVAISFSRGSSPPRDRAWVSSIAGRHFNLWATREAHAANHSPNADAHGLHLEDKGLDQPPGLLRTTLLAYQPPPKTLLLYFLGLWQIISLPRHLSWTKVIRILSFQLH